MAAADDEGWALSHLVPLPAPACEILERLQRVRVAGNPYVFPSASSRSGHLQEPARPWNRIRATANVKDVRLHDLRRTCASYLAASGYGLPLIGRVLNHSQAATTAIYARLSLDPVREALEANAIRMLNSATK